MATNHQLFIKILVDKEKNQVIYAESDHHFIDLLFSFLTLPLSTIIRLVRRNESSFHEIGCIQKLYDSVSNLNTSYLQTDASKKMLLCPERALETECNKLKINLEGKKHRELYLCGTFSADCMLSGYSGVRCACGSLTNKSAHLEEPKCVSWINGEDDDGVFVKGAFSERYIVSDELQVMEGSIGTCMHMFERLGVGDDMSKIEERTVYVGLQEILQILRRSLCSNTPLSDVFLSNQRGLETTQSDLARNSTRRDGDGDIAGSNGKNFKLKLIMNKFTNEILYAESENSLVNQLLSFLTFPLGSVFQVLEGKPLKGSIDNIYSSVKTLRLFGLLKSKKWEMLLMKPKLAPFYGCDDQLLSVEENGPRRYNCTEKTGTGWKLFVLTEVDEEKMSSVTDGLVVRNPKFPFPENNTGGGFVKGASKFMITNDLVVTPFSHTSCFLLLKKLNVPYRDIEERVVDVGEEEVLRLLKASLVSDTALAPL